MTAKKNKEKATMKDALEWKPVVIRLGDLIPNEINPKSSDDATIARLNDSIDTLGQFETLAVDSDGVSALDGHQRLNAWIAAKGEDFKVEARKASRPVTDEEKRKIILYSGKGTHGQWDFDMLADNFEPVELEEWGGFDLDGEVNTDGNPTTDGFKDVGMTELDNKCPKCGYEFD